MQQTNPEFPPEALGPKMLALKTDAQRKFALLMACGETSATQAAKDAGYSPTGDGPRVQAATLMRNPAVLEAIEETARKVFRGLIPLAIRAARDILEDKSHPARARMAETILDRTGYSAKTEHHINVQHTVDTTLLEDLARQVALETGIPPERLLGVNNIKQIEMQATEVPNAD